VGAQTERLYDRVQMRIRLPSSIVEWDHIIKCSKVSVVHVGAGDGKVAKRWGSKRVAIALGERHGAEI
jgi:hypothetical protein